MPVTREKRGAVLCEAADRAGLLLLVLHFLFYLTL